MHRVLAGTQRSMSIGWQRRILPLCPIAWVSNGRSLYFPKFGKDPYYMALQDTYSHNTQINNP